MKAGRKRAFDKGAALDKAMRVFWNNGYSGTSISQLSTVLGINPPSLYSAFGNKDQLFKDSILHYCDIYTAQCYQHLTEPSDRSAIEKLTAYFEALIELFTNDLTPKGCLMVKSANESGGEVFPKALSLFLADLGKNIKKIMMDFLRSDLRLNKDKNEESIDDIAEYILTVSFGLAVQARRGQPKEKLIDIVQMFISTIARSLSRNKTCIS